MEHVSKLELVSIGIVAANKPLYNEGEIGSYCRDIEVVLIENSNFFDGDISDDPFPETHKGKDADGADYEILLTSTPSVKAKWLPLGEGNRITAPDVRRGERVRIFRVADVDGYWWATLTGDTDWRKLETVVYAFSGTRDEDKKTSPENCYFLEISTHKKLVHFHTSKADGELWGYDIQINTEPGQGFIKIQDDDNNFIILDSKERQIIAQNKDLSKVDINKRDITIDAPDNIFLRARNIKTESETLVRHSTHAEELSQRSVIASGQRDVHAQTNHFGNVDIDGRMNATTGFSGGGAFGGGERRVDIHSFEAGNPGAVTGGRNRGANNGLIHTPNGSTTTEHEYNGYNFGYQTPGAVGTSGSDYTDPILDIDFDTRTVKMWAKEYNQEVLDVKRMDKHLLENSLDNTINSAAIIQKGVTNHTETTGELSEKSATHKVDTGAFEETSITHEATSTTSYTVTTPQLNLAGTETVIEGHVVFEGDQVEMLHDLYVHHHFWSANYGVGGTTGLQTAFDNFNATVNGQLTSFNGQLSTLDGRVTALENP
jgi:hypothetical protein